MKMRELVKALLLKNRTIVSADTLACMEMLSRELPLELHRYPSGAEFGTWVIPPQWDVKRAVLSDGKRVLASYDDHPLFLAPYSHSFTGWVTRDELLAHVRTNPETPDAFLYEYRLAYNFQRRLKEWAISLPFHMVQSLDKPSYYVDIQVETKPGEMLVAEHVLPGHTGYTFAFLTHVDHPGQANDGLAGVAIGLEVMKRLREEFSQPNFNYQLLIMPETIGSAVYLATHEDRIDNYLGSIFIEMAGIRQPLRIGYTRRGTTYLDRVLRAVVAGRAAPFQECGYSSHWGNDEYVFDSPGVGVPGAAIERWPFHWYHTSGDNMEITDEGSMEEIADILVEMVRVFESDFTVRPRQRVPVYLTRFNLYADWERQRAQYDLNDAVIQGLWDGRSVFDLALTCGVPYAEVREYVMGFVHHELMTPEVLSPGYFRRGPGRAEEGEGT